MQTNPGEPPAYADRGRHPGFSGFNVAGGPGSLAERSKKGGRPSQPEEGSSDNQHHRQHVLDLGHGHGFRYSCNEGGD